MEFDTQGLRSNLDIDIVYLSDKGQQKAGTFKPVNNEKVTFLPKEDDEINSDDLSITAMTFNVIIAVVCQFCYSVDEFLPTNH